MGRIEDNISSGKMHPTMRVPVLQLSSLTPPAGYPQRQNVLPLLVSDQSRRDIVPRSRENVPLGPPPRYHDIQRDVLMHSDAAGGLSVHHSAGVDSTAQLPGGILNRVFLVEDSMQPLQDMLFQPPTMSNATAHSYGGNITLPSGVGASTTGFTNNRYMLDAGSPAQISGEIPDRTSVLANPVQLRRDTVSELFRGISSYGSNTIVPRYEEGIMRVSESATESFRSSSSSIPASEILHSIAHQPTPFAVHTAQTVSFGGHGAQKSASLQVFCVDGLLIDLPDRETNDDIIIVGKCLRTDSACGLWVRSDKGSIRRHVQEWHGITRGGDTSIVPCTWAGCHAKMQKAAVARHTLRKHFHETFQCIGCLGYFSRGDCWRSHAAKCRSSNYGYIVTYCPTTCVQINVKSMSLM
ncbi:hypothetical protein BDR04DRAFT_815945 [Suillus decipiens]|nr:hypothetical protein BDR04DRAFT_815945 [Suillus decipiens]